MRILCGLLLALVGVPRPAGAEGGPLRFAFEKLKSDRGVIRCALYASQKTHLDVSFREALSAVQGGRAACTFEAPPPGVYSMCAFHDENNNGKLDTNVFGIPKEGVGCSNNARGTLGPPRWKDAQFQYTGAPLQQAGLLLRY